jgi:DNA-directed RNA polymerase specialized sigma54-like protein
MPLKPGLKVQQTQRLILTPAMRQSIKILQMSALDLSDLIQRELDENPLLTAEPNYSQGEKADLQIALDTIPNHQSLAETLHSQIGLMAAPEKTKAIAYGAVLDT